MVSIATVKVMTTVWWLMIMWLGVVLWIEILYNTILSSFFIFPELKTRIRKLDHETSDLKFLNNQYVHKVRCLEKDSKAKTERIQQLQEKNMQAVVQTPGKCQGVQVHMHKLY